MKISVDLAGLKPMQKKFLKGVPREKITKVVQLNLKALTEKAQENAPVRTGHLKGSIKPKMVDATTGEVTATAEYAEYVELGTRFMLAQPYMKPAAEAQEPVFISDIKKLIMKELG